MLKVILALNIKRAKEGLLLLQININILANCKDIKLEDKIQGYNFKIKEYEGMIKKDNLTMPKVDEILSFISISNEQVMSNFTNSTT